MDPAASRSRRISLPACVQIAFGGPTWQTHAQSRPLSFFEIGDGGASESRYHFSPNVSCHRMQVGKPLSFSDGKASRIRRRMIVFAVCINLASPTLAQSLRTESHVEDSQTPAAMLDRPGQVADSIAGHVGQRQTRDQVASYVGSITRINSRISNRIQSRIRYRIDRNYNPRIDSRSNFEDAEEQSRKTGGR